MAGQPSPAQGGAVSTPAQQPEAPWGFEVWYQPSPPVTGASLETSHVPRPIVPFVPQQEP